MHGWVGCCIMYGRLLLMLTSCSLGEVCSHVAALLFKVEAANRMGYTRPSRTSLPCQWNRSFKTGVNLFGIIDVSSYFINYYFV